jgi:hypothetical protein
MKSDFLRFSIKPKRKMKHPTKGLAMRFKEEDSTTPYHLTLAKFDWGAKHLSHINLKTMQIP